MSIDEFISEWTGKPADFDGVYGNQCVDLFNFYNRDVVGAPFIPTPDTGGAADLYNDYAQTPAKDYYDRIANTPTGVPQKGDVMVWAANTPATGPAGHVGIFVAGDASNFTSFDQNYPTGSLPHLQSHNYTGVLGWLRPKGGSMATDALTKEEIIEAHELAFQGDTPPQDVIDAFTGKPLDGFLQYIHQGDAWKNRVSSISLAASQLSTTQQQLADTQKQLADCQQAPPPSSTPQPSQPVKTVRPAWLASLLTKLGLYI